MKRRKIAAAAVFLAAALLLASCTGGGSDQLGEISEGFGVPREVLSGLESETADFLYETVSSGRLTADRTDYARIYTTDTGEVVMEKADYEEYLAATASPEPDGDTSGGWVRLYTAIYETDETSALVSCAVTWLIPAAPGLRDVMGISFENGTLSHDTVGGFYWQNGESQAFGAADIDEFGGGATASFPLTGDENTGSEGAFMYLSFIKEGNSEGVSAAYAHQEMELDGATQFSVDPDLGITFPGGSPVEPYYVQEASRISITW